MRKQERQKLGKAVRAYFAARTDLRARLLDMARILESHRMHRTTNLGANHSRGKDQEIVVSMRSLLVHVKGTDVD